MVLCSPIRLWAETTTRYLHVEDAPKTSPPPWDESTGALNITVILTDRIGDAFNSIYFLANIRRIYPLAKVTYVTHLFGDPAFGRLVMGQYADKVLFVEDLKEEMFLGLKPNIIFDLNPGEWLFPYYPAWSCPRIGHHARCDYQVPQRTYNWKANDHLNVLKFFGKDVIFDYSPIRVHGRQDRRLGRFVPARQYVVLCMEATARTWMLREPLIDGIVEYLLSSTALDVVILGSDINRHGYACSHNSQRIHQLTGRLSLFSSVHMIAHAKYVISVDTGLMHAASYLGVPLLAIFTCGNSAKNGPQGRRGKAVVLRVRTDPPSEATLKRDYLQSGREREFLRLDHVAEGLEALASAEESLVTQRFASRATIR